MQRIQDAGLERHARAFSLFIASSHFITAQSWLKAKATRAAFHHHSKVVASGSHQSTEICFLHKMANCTTFPHEYKFVNVLGVIRPKKRNLGPYSLNYKKAWPMCITYPNLMPETSKPRPDA